MNVFTARHASAHVLAGRLLAEPGERRERQAVAEPAPGDADRRHPQRRRRPVEHERAGEHGDRSGHDPPQPEAVGRPAQRERHR